MAQIAPRINVDSEVHFGKPVIEGTRVPVAVVVGAIAAGDSPEEVAREYGITFPLGIDPSDKYTASNAYGLTNVPTIFLVEPDGGIALSSVGWSKAGIEVINRRVAQAAGAKPKPVFKPGEDVPEFKAG